MATNKYEYLKNIFCNKHKNFKSIFRNGITYKVPLSQRSYSWDEEQWKDFWEDILGLLSKEGNHYMGPLVLQPERPGDEKNFLVIDGQQRLATLSIIILAVISRLSTIAEGEASAGGEVSNGRDKQRKEAEERIDSLRKQYIGSQDPDTPDYDTRLRLNKGDDPFYRGRLVPLISKSSRSPETPSQKLLNNALNSFEKKLKKKYKDSSEELAKFVETITDKLTFKVRFVDDEGKASTVFETLNARGVQLTLTDLLKNRLFSMASKKNLEEMEGNWERMINTLGKEDVIDFIRAYWYSCYELKKGGRGTNLCKIISRKVKDEHSAFVLVNDLNENANIYVALKDPHHSKWKEYSSRHEDFKKHLKELKIFGNITRPSLLLFALPLLLALYRKYMEKNRKQFLEFLEYITVITFRYNVICQFATREQETIYNKAALAIHKGKLSEAKTHLKTLYEKVGDEIFKQLFSERELNHNHKQQIRYILRKLENNARPGESDRETSGMMTTEHIFPRSSTHHADWDDEINLKNHINRLGNLTPLTEEEHKGVDNSSYDAKRPTYKKSSYRLTSSIYDNYLKWNVASIENRQRCMADRAVKIWSIPIATSGGLLAYLKLKSIPRILYQTFINFKK